jgi:GTP cyclohydrolase II
MLLYGRQEGRGKGLMEKLRACELQDQGLDTIEATFRLGHEADLRDYALQVRLPSFFQCALDGANDTNNPEKIGAVLSSGIEIADRVSADVSG